MGFFDLFISRKRDQRRSRGKCNVPGHSHPVDDPFMGFDRAPRPSAHMPGMSGHSGDGPTEFGRPRGFGQPPGFGQRPSFGQPPGFGHPPSFGEPPDFGPGYMHAHGGFSEGVRGGRPIPPGMPRPQSDLGTSDNRRPTRGSGRGSRPGFGGDAQGRSLSEMYPELGGEPPIGPEFGGLGRGM
ncbi:hypothetical protein EK21DRAFT_88100 [Setomelanomma holmii]|uniref:Uncharacterized protein n=1 Tax=Setomelanomma holmii TaxID=210430 RepID=A0A9P4HDL2_9PLEO|nr:hypothetical protein EK21DRAFT_88100 [Setomelanomma holmii]